MSHETRAFRPPCRTLITLFDQNQLFGQVILDWALAFLLNWEGSLVFHPHHTPLSESPMRKASALPLLLSGLSLMLTAAQLRAEDVPQQSTPATKKVEEKAKKQKKEDIPSAVVVISATRTERAEKDTTTTVTVTTEKEIERQLVTNIIDLTRNEPGVEVSNQPDRQGASSFSIRGIGGNRVLILVDGVNLPDGAEASRGLSRDFVDLDTLKRVEILRGSGSALYGSDALAGVVTYTTLDPADLLSADGHFGGRLKTGYASVNNQKSNTAIVAGRQGEWDGILTATYRVGNETTPATGTPNPMQIDSTSVLGKLGWKPNAHNQVRFGFQGFERKDQIHLLNCKAQPSAPPAPSSSRTWAMTGTAAISSAWNMSSRMTRPSSSGRSGVSSTRPPTAWSTRMSSGRSARSRRCWRPSATRTTTSIRPSGACAPRRSVASPWGTGPTACSSAWT